MKDLNKDLNNMSDLNKDLNKDVNRDNTTPINETGSVRLYKNNNYDFQYGKFYTVKDIGRVLKVPDIELNDKLLGQIVSISMDKYFTNEHLNFKNPVFEI